MKDQKVRLVQRAQDLSSKGMMEIRCDEFAEENNCTLTDLSKSWKWAYTAEFKDNIDGSEFGGVMIAVKSEGQSEFDEVDILFDCGQMVGNSGQHVVEENEYYEELGIG